MSAVASDVQQDVFHGEILDADGHLYVHPDDMEAVYGKGAAHGVTMPFLREYVHSDEYKTNRANNAKPESLWTLKGMGALGAFDVDERRAAIEAQGAKAQLIFANNGNWEVLADSDDAREVCQRYNDYVIDVTRRTGSRARPTCHINMGNVEWALKETERVIKAGAKGVLLPSNQPPAGASPAHEQWDPMWAMLQEAGIPATIHLGTSAGVLSDRGPDTLMFPDPRWADSKTLRNRPAFRAGGEEAISPYFMLVAHMSPELFLQTLVMGKVFERFPRLAFGIIEFGASWVGPCVERMDLWSDFMNKIGVKYDMKPSEYVRRNVRVTPFWHEDLPKMISRFGLKEVYCYNSDYPHLEGSKDPIGKFRKHLAKIDDPAYPQAFFCDNAKILFQDA